MTKKVRGAARPTILRRLLAVSAVLLVLALVFVAPAAAVEISVNSQTELENFLNAADCPTELTINLADSEYTLGSSLISGKIITFNGTKQAVIIFELVGNYEIGVNAEKITFNGITVKFDETKTTDYHGLSYTQKVVYNDCTLIGTQCLYHNEYEFIKCTFENKNYWSVIVRGAKNVKFSGCTFNTGGHAVLTYNEESGTDFVAHVTFDNCVFNNDGSVNEPIGETWHSHEDLVESGQTPYGANTYYLTFNDCRIEGKNTHECPHGAPSQFSLWGNKNSMDYEHLIVVENGVEVTASVDMDGVTLIDKEYDGNPLTYTGEAVFIEKPTRGSSGNPVEPVTFTYTWYEKNSNGEYVLIGNEAPKDVGEYQLNATADTNAYLRYAVKDVAISEKTLTVTPVSWTKMYGMADPELTYTYSGNVTNEIPAFSGKLIRAAGENVGTYLISGKELVLDNNGNFKAANYELAVSSDVYFTITPEVLAGNDVPVNYGLAVKQVSTENQDTLTTTIEESYADEFTNKFFVGVSLYNDQNQRDSNTKITFIVTYESLGISAADAEKYDFVVLHLKADGSTEIVPYDPTDSGLKIGPTSTSPFVIGYTLKQEKPQTGDSSKPKGTSVWLQEPATPTPTETVTPTETQPTETAEPTPTETESPLSVLAVLGGLGAVAALRRK